MAGSKLWRQKYRFGGKESRLAHGRYPEVCPAQARERRNDARKLLAQGADPAAHRKAEKLAGEERATNSFEFGAREWFTKFSQRLAKSHSDKIRPRVFLSRLDGNQSSQLAISDKHCNAYVKRMYFVQHWFN